MKKVIVLIISIIFLSVSLVTAQNPPPPPTGTGDFNPVGGGDPVAVPIDGGALVLLLAGAAYGAKKLRDKKK